MRGKCASLEKAPSGTSGKGAARRTGAPMGQRPSNRGTELGKGAKLDRPDHQVYRTRNSRTQWERPTSV